MQGWSGGACEVHPEKWPIAVAAIPALGSEHLLSSLRLPLTSRATVSSLSFPLLAPGKTHVT